MTGTTPCRNVYVLHNFFVPASKMLKLLAEGERRCCEHGM